MKRRPDPFEIVRRTGLAMPGVTEIEKAGVPRLTFGGSFMAAIASHPSAEPDSLVIRSEIEDRDLLIADAPDTYYITDFYRPYPLVLVRLSRVGPDALRDLMSVSWRMTAAKTRKPPKPRRGRGSR
jgi:hypothetical protein